jgi:methionine synthase I (cobalamin-dependent)
MVFPNLQEILFCLGHFDLVLKTTCSTRPYLLHGMIFAAASNAISDIEIKVSQGNCEHGPHAAHHAIN